MEQMEVRKWEERYKRFKTVASQTPTAAAKLTGNAVVEIVSCIVDLVTVGIPDAVASQTATAAAELTRNAVVEIVPSFLKCLLCTVCRTTYVYRSSWITGANAALQ